MSKETILRKPDWLRVRVGHGPEFKRVEEIIKRNDLHTVCEEALCPNRGECWCKGRATIMILGGECTRGCKFCNVRPSTASGSVDVGEPQRVADAVKEAGLSEVVITSVTRDDLNDGGADIWARTIAAVRQAAPSVMLEVLVPDFAGNESAIERVLAAKPDVFGHNLETVPRLYADVRPEANYTRSLELLGQSASCGLITKTSLMLGLGETIDEVAVVMSDARERGCRVFFLGQYLRPSKEHCAVERYVEPDEFEELKRRGVKLGFDVVVSAPLVRSSYHSDEQTDFVKRVLIEKG